MNFQNKNLKKIIIITCAVVLLLVIAISFVKCSGNKKADKASEVPLSMVERGNVELTISGSGTVEPYERYEIIPLVNGEILSCPYEVGDVVEEGAIIYEFDKSDALLNFQKQNNSMEKSTLTYNQAMKEADKLNVKSASSGRIKKVYVEEGDEISPGATIATIQDDVNLKVTVPFNKEQASDIQKGDTALLSSSSQMSNFYGTVLYVDQTPSATTDGSSVYYVTIEFTNPGAVTSGTDLGCRINGHISPGYGTVLFGEEKSIKAETEGTVAKLHIQEGAYVTKDMTIATLTSDTLTNSLQRSRLEYSDAQLSLKSQKDSLDDYSITSPISGTVLTKNSKQGDTIDRSNSSVTMMVIGDISKLKFNLSIDELDISEVSIGQKVKVTCDAVPYKEFEGEISTLSMEGTASNGVTTYDATVIINNPGELKPSMNVDAVVVIKSSQNTLRVPSSDVKTAMGVSYVYVKNEDVTDENLTVEEAIKAEENKQPANTDGNKQMPNGQAGTEENKQFPRGEGAPNGNRQMPDGNRIPGGGNRASVLSRLQAAPEGFTAVIVEIGVEGDEFTEILSGLSEGQRLYQQTTSSSASSPFGMMHGGMMGGGMMGGGMTGGGMSSRGTNMRPR